jgi:DNA phosphorothioation-dependent restriction protein DptH
MIGGRHAEHMSKALRALVGAPVDGAVAFLRCLPSNLLDELIDAPGFDIEGWRVTAVVEKLGSRRITADQAVEQREDKAEPAFFLIDPLRAGAGLDGIYSAAREITEAELFKSAQKEARRVLYGRLKTIDSAIKRAQRLGRRQTLTPWQVFDFHVAVEKEPVGAAITRLGLWPIEGAEVPTEDDLNMAAIVSDRLLFHPDAQPARDRVNALLLGDAEQVAALESFLRKVENYSPFEGVRMLEDHPNLWLGSLQPRFSGQILQRMDLTTWLKPNGEPQRWSGLIPGEEKDAPLRLVLDRSLNTRDQARLEVRWTTEPDTVPAGSVEYRVTIIAGDEELAFQSVGHKEKSPQKVIFRADDFADFDDAAKFEAVVRVEAIGADGVLPAESEGFVLEFGQTQEKVSLASGQIVRAIVEGVISRTTFAEFEDSAEKAHLAPHATQDKKGYVSWRVGSGRGVRVIRPVLIRMIEESFCARKGTPGRWHLRVRSDGTPNEGLQFTPFDPGECDPGVWEKVESASRRLAEDLGPFGLVARVQKTGWSAGESYVRAWTAAIEQAPEMALQGTLEVQTLSGRTLGLIVTPLHPLRLAWHGLYDHVAAQARYEQGLSAQAVSQTLQSVDGAHVPPLLPGAGGVRGFLFADTLGFHAVAMTVDGEEEPKAAVALMAAALGAEGVAPSIGAGSSSVLAREIMHYITCHGSTRDANQGFDLLNLQAWRAGDGKTVARALGRVLDSSPEAEDAEEKALCFTLDLHHPKATSWGSGRFLNDVGRKRRSGSGVAAEDRWMTETARRDGEIIVPRLRWALKDETALLRPSHIAVAFDVFAPSLEVRPKEGFIPVRPLHAHGLVNVIERRIELEGDPEWLAYAPPALDGAKAPDNRNATDRFLHLSTVIAEATARKLGGGAGDWPAVVTRLPVDSRRWIDRLHERSDWVITIDRNSCIEYFDAPLLLPEIYERFVIDAVPERSDLGTYQLITTTKNLDEVRDLVDVALGDMGLTSSERNSRFLLNQLKALSGRLAMRLANHGAGTGELIALAIMRACCANPPPTGPSAWLDLKNGFLIPVDEIADRPPVKSLGVDGTDISGRRADFVHVQAPGNRGQLQFRFVEVKHRLHLRTVRQPELLRYVCKQTGDLCERWHTYYFDASIKPLERALRMSQLALLLRFYADRAFRHGLDAQAYGRLSREIDALVIKEDYQPADIEDAEIGYIFCPEHRTSMPERLYVAGGEKVTLWLFGPSILPDDIHSPVSELNALSRGLVTIDTASPKNISLSVGKAAPTEARPCEDFVTEAPVSVGAESMTTQTPRPPSGSKQQEADHDRSVEVRLGTVAGGSDAASWRVSIRANPHMMVVGLPGMGKTTCLVNICRQLQAANIAPVVFSYHEDIDEKLGEALGQLDFVDYHGLGFNPLRVDTARPTSHVDVAGMLRDIFSSIFPDLGDLQLEELRQSIKQSFENVGWGMPSDVGTALPPPPFRAFLDILNAKTKPSAGLLARLQELADYGFFEAAGDRASVLFQRRPTIVRIHSTRNEMLQNAFASFVFYSLYKDMFRRGVQGAITHAIVFDEAHRAARLKLIPQFAKECRKYGLSLVLASQEAKDFAPALFSAIGNYLVLRVTEPDARTLSRMTAATADEKRVADQMKTLPRYHAIFLAEGKLKPSTIALEG